MAQILLLPWLANTRVSRCSCENLRYIRKEVISFLTCQQERTPMMSSLSDMEDCV